MKALYIINQAGSGVIKKFTSKINSLNEMGIDVSGVIIDTEAPQVKSGFDFIAYSETKKYSRILNQRIFWTYLYYLKSKDYYQHIETYLKDKTFDVLIFRYGNNNRAAYNFYKKYKGKLIFEVNTDVLPEMKTGMTGSFLQDQWMLIRYKNEQLFGAKILKLSKCVIGVTHEISGRLKVGTKNKVKVVTISNSFPVNSVPIYTPLAFDPQKIKMIISLTAMYSWHGVDRFIAGLKRYKGNYNMEFHIVGPVASDYIDKISEKLTLFYYSNKTGTELDNLFNTAHIAVGSFAAHRKGIVEGSALKTREYLSRGIPFVYGYKDSDIEEPSVLDGYCLNLKPAPNDDPIDIERVIKFYEEVYQKKDFQEIIREYALNTIDTKIKMNLLKEAINN